MSPLFLVTMTTIIGTTMACTVTPTSTTYTTTDASILTSIAYIANFNLENCKGEKVVYALDDQDNVLTVAMTTEEGGYQVSFTRELKSASRGTHTLRLISSDLKKPVTIATVEINHPGAYAGPWLSSEHLAAILGLLVVYVGVSGKSNLLA